MLPNYLRTYSSALCQIRALEKAFKKQTMAKVYPKSWFWMHAFDWPKYTQNLHAILYVFCLLQWLVQCCADKPTWGHIPQLFATFEPWRRHLRRVTSAKGSQKSEFYMLAFDWLEQTNKIGCNIFPGPAAARMTCAELWCQTVWEHFPQLCVKFQPWRKQLVNMFVTTPYF